MGFRIMRLLAMAAMVAAIVSLGSPAFAQTYTGRIEVTVEDSTGGRLPGVTVTLSGQMDQSVVTDARGEARFLNLAVGKYMVTATLGVCRTFIRPRVHGDATPTHRFVVADGDVPSGGTSRR
jgi:hypothetical protein